MVDGNIDTMRVNYNEYLKWKYQTLWAQQKNMNLNKILTEDTGLKTQCNRRHKRLKHGNSDINTILRNCGISQNHGGQY